MTKDQLLKQPLWQFTGEQFLELLNLNHTEEPQTQNEASETKSRTYVYGIPGLCKRLHLIKFTRHLQRIG